MAGLVHGGWIRSLLLLGLLGTSLLLPSFVGAKPVATSDLTFDSSGCTIDIHAEWANQPLGSLKRYDVALQNNVTGTTYGPFDVRMTRSGVVDLHLPLAADPGNPKTFTAYLRFYDRNHLVADYKSAGGVTLECQ